MRSHLRDCGLELWRQEVVQQPEFDWRLRLFDHRQHHDFQEPLVPAAGRMEHGVSWVYGVVSHVQQVRLRHIPITNKGQPARRPRHT